MKYIYLITVIMTLFSCNAQTVIPMNSNLVPFTNGAYYSDTDYELNKYIGTWKYENGNENLIIVLQKILNHQYRGYSKDILIGEYKYVDATGVTIVNTLPLMNVALSSQLLHNISGANILYKLSYPKCLECADDEFRVDSNIDDPERNYVDSKIVFRWMSPTQIKAKIYSTGSPLSPAIDSPTTIRVPNVEYVLNKI
ncbi:DUF6705 family protein [Flavobacterium sp.]|uniref:DUF6705 family protein n=1 Tax=Flavobacterium sp. TaxID=239 RepID=UPI003752AD8A